jgi:hypothetical protein
VIIQKGFLILWITKFDFKPTFLWPLDLRLQIKISSSLLLSHASSHTDTVTFESTFKSIKAFSSSIVFFLLCNLSLFPLHAEDDLASTLHSLGNLDYHCFYLTANIWCIRYICLQLWMITFQHWKKIVFYVKSILFSQWSILKS